MRMMRLRHECGRNLADVTQHHYVDLPGRAEGPGLVVLPRPSVRQEDYRSDPAEFGGDWVAKWLAGDSTRRRDRRPEATSGVTRPQSYTWHCKCGAPVNRRYERVLDYWHQHADRPEPLVVVTLVDDQ
jgi:hypothetical protein